MEIATTNQKKARLLDLATGILEMTRDGNRDIDEILDIFQLIKDNPKFATQLLVKDETPASVPKPAHLSYPAAGVVFELTLDGDDPANDPIEMVRRDGYDSAGWKFNGQRVAGVQIRRFKIISVGYCRNLDEVRQKLARHGTVPEG